MSVMTRIFTTRRSKQNRFNIAYYPYSPHEMGSELGVTSVTPNKYAIELRDKDFNLKARLENYATSVRWDWNRQGGCGKCSITLQLSTSLFDVNADDDVRIYLPDSGGTTATLWYRGYVDSISPNLNGSSETINIECSGYFDWMKRLVVQDSGVTKTYTSKEVSEMVTDIIDTFVTPNSSITKGTIEGSTFSVDTLSFKGTVSDALQTLFDLLGNIEYGVGPDLVFFWKTESGSISRKYYLGDRVIQLTDRVNFRDIINKIYLEGGTSGGSTYVASATADDSQQRYGKHDAIISNGSVTSQVVASQYMAGIFRQYAKPSRPVSIRIVGCKDRFESSTPMGAVSIVDPENNQSGAIYGTTGNGGDNVVYGTKTAGGSGQVYGGSRRDQLDRVSYTLHPEDGRIDATLQLGDSSEVSRISAFLNQLQATQEALRQRSL